MDVHSSKYTDMLAQYRVTSQVYHPCAAPQQIQSTMDADKRLVPYQVVLIDGPVQASVAVVLSLWTAARPRPGSISTNCQHRLGGLPQVRGGALMTLYGPNFFLSVLRPVSSRSSSPAQPSPARPNPTQRIPV